MNINYFSELTSLVWLEMITYSINSTRNVPLDIIVRFEPNIIDYYLLQQEPSKSQLMAFYNTFDNPDNKNKVFKNIKFFANYTGNHRLAIKKFCDIYNFSMIIDDNVIILSRN